VPQRHRIQKFKHFVLMTQYRLKQEIKDNCYYETIG